MRYFLPIICLFLFAGAQAQEMDSLQLDSLQQRALITNMEDSTAALAQADTMVPKKKIGAKVGTFFHKLLVKDYPNPRKALILGLVIPGAGQAYNGSFWKIPIVVGGIGTTIYNIDKNRDLYIRLRDAYHQRVNTDGENTDEFSSIYLEDSQLKTVRDAARKNMELSWIALVGVSLLSAAEALVDAHLKDFDVSDDISFRPKLSIGQDQVMGNYAGLGISLRLQ